MNTPVQPLVEAVAAAIACSQYEGDRRAEMWEFAKNHTPDVARYWVEDVAPKVIHTIASCASAERRAAVYQLKEACFNLATSQMGDNPALQVQTAETELLALLGVPPVPVADFRTWLVSEFESLSDGGVITDTPDGLADLMLDRWSVWTAQQVMPPVPDAEIERLVDDVVEAAEAMGRLESTVHPDHMAVADRDRWNKANTELGDAVLTLLAAIQQRRVVVDDEAVERGRQAYAETMESEGDYTLTQVIRAVLDAAVGGAS